MILLVVYYLILLRHLVCRSNFWNGPLQRLDIDVNNAAGDTYHMSAFVKILQTQASQTSTSWLSITIAYTLQGQLTCENIHGI